HFRLVLESTVFGCLYILIFSLESPGLIVLENSTFEIRYFAGGLPFYSPSLLNLHAKIRKRDSLGVNSHR
ncbi:hypothetical protein, partial [Legionella drozanskii]